MKKLFVGVGVNSSSGSTKLEGCENDIDSWWNFLSTKGYSLNEPLIKTKIAKKDRILSALENLVSELSHSNDIGIFVYSGHGKSSLISGKIYEYIATLNNIISDLEISERIQNPNRLGRLVFVLDCCYASDVIYKFRFEPSRYKNIPEKTIEVRSKSFSNVHDSLYPRYTFNPTRNYENVIVIAACGRNRKAKEVNFGTVQPKWNGVLTKYAIDALRDNFHYKASIFQIEIRNKIPPYISKQKPMVLPKNFNKSIFTQ